MTDEEAFRTAVEALKFEFGVSGGFEYEHFSEQDSLAYRIVDADWALIWRSLFTVSSNSSPGHIHTPLSSRVMIFKNMIRN
jgi:hypothetical protein